MGLFPLLIAVSLGAGAARVPFWFAEFPDAKVRVNYDEASVPPYTLEDPLVFADGRKVETEADWQERRAEILGIFAREMYGKRPPLPEALVADLADERVTCGGTVVQRQYEMSFRADRTGPKIRWITFLPKEAKGKVPVILFLNYHGNQSLVDDPSVPMMTAWHRNGQWATNNLAVPATRGLLQRPSDSATTFPLSEFVRRGYAVMSACYCEVSPDPNRIGKEDPKPMQDKLAYTGVFDLWPKRDPDGKSETTSLGAWSWALSRGLDLAERIPEIDAKRSVVTGYSRLGKAALLAAAYDERFAVCVPVQTGNGGAPLAKRDFGENPGTETRQFTHWFCRAYDKYRVEPWKTLAFDQHLLLAAVAPRPLLVLGFNSNWFDPRGEFLSCRAASAVWERFAGGGLPRTDFPKTGETTAVGDRLGYARRDGAHAINDWDWRNILDFADTSFGCLPAFPRTDLKDGGFQAKIDAAAARGGGCVTVPAGHWLTGGLVLRSNVELHLEKGALLEGSPRTNDYPVVELPYSEGRWMAVVMAVSATNVAVTGEGEIYGNGSVFPRAHCKQQEGTRPRGLFFGNCHGVRLEDFTLRDAGCWGCVVQCCEKVEIRRLVIDSHANWNNDGIDLEAKDVVIEGCDIDAGDDGICLKSNNPDFTVENVLVTNCIVRSHCVPLKLGTSTHGIVRNVLFTDCRTAAPCRDHDADPSPLVCRPSFWRADWGPRDFPGSVASEPSACSAIAVECVDGGLVENLAFRNIVIDGGCLVPIFVRANRRPRFGTGAPRGKYDILRNVTFENITGHSLSAVPSSVTGIPSFRVQDVTFRNVRLVGRGGGENAAERTRPVPELEDRTPSAGMFRQALPAYGLWARHVDGLKCENSVFSLAPGMIDRRESVVLDDVNTEANPDVRAVQLDLARQMETVPFVKAFTRKVADAGYNTLVLYLEGRVRTPSFSLGEDESYSLDEMREIVACASGCGVEVVPVVSVLGHAEHFFRNPGLEAFAEERGGLCRWPVTKMQSFCLNQPEARRFLEKYISEVAAAFPGKDLHLGLDESFQFGFCDTCRARREEIGFGPLFTEYVKWADGLCHKLGKRMWMWDDMYEFFPEELENVPRDIVMCHWIYDNDVTEWGHRGHFLNRIRIDWLAEYEKRGIDAIPVGAACVDNLKTLGDYAKRHRTLGTYVSQWELSDSFYGAPISILIGIDRAFPSLNPMERRAVEALSSTWAYFRSNGGVSLSRSRRNGRISADVTLNESEPAAVRLALAVLKGAKSHPGAGEVPADPLSEEALLDDLVTHFEQILFKYELDDISVALATPRRMASESRTAKERVCALIPEMRRVLARKESQERLWRPNMRPNGLTAPMKDNLDYAEKLLSVPDVASDEDWILGLSLSMPDYHGLPQWKISGLFPDGWREIAKGCWKPARGNWANFERKLAFKSAEAPTALRVEHSGYGDGMLLFASVWNRNRRFVPEKVIGVSGEVVDPSNVLKDDWRPVRFGLQDRALVFVNPALSEALSTLEFSLRETGERH